MAREIKVNYGFSVSKSGLQFQYPSNSLYVTMSGIDMMAGVQQGQQTGTIGIDVGNNATGFKPGWAIFRNLSNASGELLDIGIKSGATFFPFLRLWPQEIAQCPLQQVTGLHFQSVTGQPYFSYNFFER